MRAQPARRETTFSLPSPQKVEWRYDTPFAGYCYPGIHAELAPKAAGRYLTGFPEMGITTIHLLPLAAKGRRLIGPHQLPNATSVHTSTGAVMTARWGRTIPDAGGFMPVHPGEACGIATDGCPIAVITVKSKMGRFLLVLRLHRETLIDQWGVLLEAGGTPSGDEPFTSIIADAVAWLKSRRVSAGECSFISMFGIHPKHFIHDPSDPVHGEYNSRLPQYLKHRYPSINGVIDSTGRPGLNLPAVIKAEARELDFFREIKATEHLCDDERGFAISGLSGRAAAPSNYVFIHCLPD